MRRRTDGVREPARPPPARREAGDDRDHRTDVAIELVRTVSALLGVVLLTAADLPDRVAGAAIAAHAGVIAVSVLVVVVLPRAARTGWAPLLGLAVTVGTIGFYVITTTLWHDEPGAGTALGIVALLEAPVRYGWRGAALSGFPVLWTALLAPQVDSSGSTLSAGIVTSLVVLLLAVGLTVREVMRRSLVAVMGAAHGFAEAMLHLPLGVAVLDADGAVVQSNPALAMLVGVDPDGRRLVEQLCTDDPDALREVLSGSDPGRLAVCRTADDRELAIGAASVHVAGPRRVVVHVQDVTDERRERADLLHASRHDALTGLLTRSAGTDLLTEQLAGDSPVAVLFIDLDGFKLLNDTAGHAVGDAVLRQVAGRLTRSLRPSERAVRWGGDEFVVVCSGVRDDEALGMVAARLLQVLAEPFRVDGLPLVTLTASIGAAGATRGSPVPGLLAAADRAMYEAKRAGGNRYVQAPRGVPAQREGAEAPTADAERLTDR